MDIKSWYHTNYKKYDSLATKAYAQLENCLSAEAVTYPLLQSRVKELDRFLLKMKKENYSKPEDMKDIAGLRVVCYVFSDIQIVSDLVEFTFSVNLKSDKFKMLKENRRMGYRGINYVVTLKDGPQNMKLIPFEIQVRTLLDYAWGEIEHDQNYKLFEKYPEDSDIPRRFEALAGALKTLDYAFDSLSKETKQYANEITNKIKKGELDKIHISPISVREFLIWKFDDVPGLKRVFVKPEQIMNDLTSMQIKTLSDLNNIIPKNLKEIYMKETEPEYDFLSFSLMIAEILIAHDSKYYFENVWKLSEDDTIETLDNHCYKVFNKLRLNIKLPTGFEWGHRKKYVRT
jgi:putative GTP pyrophosphokinase